MNIKKIDPKELLKQGHIGKRSLDFNKVARRVAQDLTREKKEKLPHD